MKEAREVAPVIPMTTAYPVDVHERLKSECLKRGITKKEAICTALRQWWGEKKDDRQAT